MTSTDTSTTTADRARAAHQARQLEHQAEEQRFRDTAAERVSAYALDLVAHCFGEQARDEAAVTGYPHEGSAIVEVVDGVKLQVDQDRFFRALLDCPLCDRWGCPTAYNVRDLADLGAILADDSIELEPHEPHGSAGGTCNGLQMRGPADEREAWRVDTARDPGQLYKKLNQADAEGYAPSVHGCGDGFVIVGRRIGDAIPRDPELEPF